MDSKQAIKYLAGHIAKSETMEDWFQTMRYYTSEDLVNDYNGDIEKIARELEAAYAESSKRGTPKYSKYTFFKHILGDRYLKQLKHPPKENSLKSSTHEAAPSVPMMDLKRVRLVAQGIQDVLTSFQMHGPEAYDFDDRTWKTIFKAVQNAGMEFDRVVEAFE